MTENADVEWLRERMHGGQLATLSIARGKSILAHIDKLEADIEDYKKDALRRALCNEPEPDRRPTVHEIAAQIMAAMRLASYLSHKQTPTDSETIASWSYADAEALVAEGRRRDGNG